MPDIPPAAVTGASGANTSSAGGGGNPNYQTAPANIVSLPANLQNIERTVTLGASLVGTNTDGSVVLRTAQGDVTLQLPISLQPGSQVQVQFQPGNPPSAILIFSGSDALQQAASNYMNAVLNNWSLPLPTLNMSAQAAQTQLQTGANIIALVLDAEIGNFVSLPDSATSPIAGQLLSQPGALADLLEKMSDGNTPSLEAQVQLLSELGLRPGAPSQVGQLSLSGNLLETVQKTIQLLQSQPGGAQGLSNNPVSLQVLQQVSQNAPAPTMPAPETLHVASAALPAGTELNLKLIQIIPPGQTPPAPPPGTPTLNGQVTPQIINGNPVVQTPQGAVLLHAQNNLPVGTKLVFEFVADAAIKSTSLSAALTAESARTNSAMPRLEQALLQLGGNNSDLMRAVQNSLPKLNGQFPAASLFFLEALRTGNIKNWLGEKTLEAMRLAGGGALLEEVEKEFRAAATGRGDAPLQGQWRQTNLPYMGEQGLANIRMAVRDHFQPLDPDEQGRRQSPEEFGRVTRFLFDLEFSELGPIQVDGLLRPLANSQKKQLDIVLRTRELLPAEMRGELREIFTQSLGAYGMDGGLAFQAGYQNWVRLAEAQGRATSARA